MQIVHWLQLIPHPPRRTGTLLIHQTPKTCLLLSPEASPKTVSQLPFVFTRKCYSHKTCHTLTGIPCLKSIAQVCSTELSGRFLLLSECGITRFSWWGKDSHQVSTLALISQGGLFTTLFCTSCVSSYSQAANKLLPAQMKASQKIFYLNTHLSFPQMP